METSTVEVKRPSCPNCGSYQIDQKWVKKQLKQTFQNVNFTEHADVLRKIERERGQPYDGDISINFITDKYSDYRQLVIRCTQCGYTEVFTP